MHARDGVAARLLQQHLTARTDGAAHFRRGLGQGTGQCAEPPDAGPTGADAHNGLTNSQTNAQGASLGRWETAARQERS